MKNDVRRKIDNLKDKIRKGVIPAMATPLSDGSAGDHIQVSASGVKALVDFLIDAGVKGLFVGGTTGEGILLPEEERIKLHQIAMDAIGGRIPALIHVGANTSVESVRLTKHAREIGADAIVAVTPYFYPVHDDALIEYYLSIAEAAPDTPLFAYDIPHLAINGVAPELLPVLVEAIPSFAGLKSSRPDAQFIRRLVDIGSGKTIVLAGNERIALGSLALGVDGLISGLSTAVPEPFVALVQAFAKGDIDQARIEQKRINRILDLIPSGARIGAIKMILTERGIASGPAVPPRPMPEDGWTVWSQISAELVT